MLSEEARKRLVISTTDRGIGTEIANAIDAARAQATQALTAATTGFKSIPSIVATDVSPTLDFGTLRAGDLVVMVRPAAAPIVAGMKLFVFDAPAAPSVAGIHADYAGNVDASVKASFDFAFGIGFGLLLNTVVEAVTPGLDGNSITISLVGDSVGAVTIDVNDAAFPVVDHVIHFFPGHTTVLDVENAIGALVAPYIQVKTPGTPGTVLTAVEILPPGVQLQGGLEAGTFPGPFGNIPIDLGPAPARNLTVTFGAAYDGGDVTITGLGPGNPNPPISETFIANAGATVAGVKLFAGVDGATRSGVGVAADPASIGFGSKLGVVKNYLPVALDPSTPGAVLFANDVPEAVILDATVSGFTPTTTPNGVVVFKFLVNVMGADPAGIADFFTISGSANLGRAAVVGNLYLVFRTV